MISYPIKAGSAMTRVIQGGLEGPVVVLLHGLSARADRWRHNLDALGAAGLRALAIDMPGHGFATKGADFDFSARGYSLWLEDFVRTLDVDKIVLVGTSFGGLIAAHYAADFPHRVHGLMTVGAIGLVPVGEARRQRTIQWLGEMEKEEIRARLYRGVLDPSLIDEALVEEDFRINNSAGAAESFRALADYYRDRLDDDAAAPRLSDAVTRFPVEIVWGRDDPSVSPQYGEEAHRIIEGSRLTLIDGCGHFPYWERPEVFNPGLIDFVNSCTSAPANRESGEEPTQ
jgi:pimeloyl-ACP methyl ester carboxylesterase